MPEPVPALSTARLLTMTWLEGAPMLDAAKRPLGERNEIARNMFRAWYVPFYYYGVIHGDPHLGNYTVRPDNGDQPARFRLHPHLPGATSSKASSISITRSHDDDRDLAVARL